MELKAYDKQAYEADTTAQNFYSYLEGQFKHGDSICLYKEPDYATNANVLPTFTILDKEYGIIVYKIYDHTAESLTVINDRFWEINGAKHRNDLMHFEDYCHKFKNDINLPTNEIFTDIPFHKFACFPLINKDEISFQLNRKAVTTLFDEYRQFNIAEHLEKKEIDDEDWQKLISIVQKANVLSKDVGIALEKPLKNLREAIAYNNQKIHQFDDAQLDASLTITDEAERIRGLAGTGKTVILAIKAARLHRKNPTAKIAYIFSTHSLYNQVRRLISKYYQKITGNQPDWDYLKVLHGWGGKTTGEGFYYNICKSNGFTPLTLNNLRYEENPFGAACKKLLSHNLNEEYDYVLIDEAQDMPLEFFMLVEKVTKNPKRIIWAYDELQTTSNTRIPDSVELFGLKEDGTPKVPLNQEHDYILKKSYRNHQDVLMLAFALGFGLYSDSGITQIIKDKDTWNAIGFLAKTPLIPNKKVMIERPKENSPNTINEDFPSVEILKVNNYKNKADELQSVSEEIVRLIKEQQVNPHDIMVIDMDTRPKDNLVAIQNYLYQERINSVVPGLVDGSKEFLIEDNVTLTTVRRAKGNEVPIVFVIGAERIYSYKNEYEKRIIRNMIFISITRSKGWLFLSAAGEKGDNLISEFTKIETDIKRGVYNFIFPTEEMLKGIEELNLLSADIKMVEKFQNNADALVELAKAGQLGKLDMFLDEETKKKLIEALSKK
ncbi:DEAD/DEAH box helicase [Bacillus haynesii]|uniref:DEAD/DEAH box helicase n=1 Tax=Bacillus haynesii TaxID=1925021 RepID=UPI00227FAFCA|nr:ATP-binding domain-containing protein [Bacillus haynesii]MCY8590149.1 ATP-binding domain-containing protein [Bacillus haynesii]